MQSWVFLCGKTLQAQFPYFEMLQAFDVFRLTSQADDPCQQRRHVGSTARKDALFQRLGLAFDA